MKLIILASIGLLSFGTLQATPPAFSVGKTNFRPGDSIRITNVQRGDSFLTVTADYELASEDVAKISLFITSSQNIGRVAAATTQSQTIRKGRGTVVLHHPDTYEGMPHVSFYPAKGGNGLGGVYFSTGPSFTTSKSRQSGVDTSFALGNASFRPGDSIRILSVKRSADLLTVTAEYDLASQDQANLHLYVTSGEKSPPFDARQATSVAKGQGRITLHHPSPPKGQPHLTFYDPASRQAIGGIYLGTSEEAAESTKYNLGYMIK